MITPEEAKDLFRGVVVPVPTIFTKDGSIDTEATASNVQWLIDRGARQGNTILLAVGSGGDFTALTTDERKQTIKAIVDVNRGRLPTMASSQSTDVRVCIELAQFCEEVGIDAIQISGPFYYDGKTGDFIAWMEELARHTQVGFAIYNHYYTAAKYDMPIELVDRLLEIPNSVAVKWGTPSMEKFYEGVRRFLPRAAVVDNTLMPVMGHILGLRAWISHVPNFFPEHSWRVWDLMEEGQYREAQRVNDAFMVPFIDLVGQIQQATAGEGIFVKAAMEAVGGLCVGYSRLPSRDVAVTPEIREGFKKLLDQANLDAYV